MEYKYNHIYTLADVRHTVFNVPHPEDGRKRASLNGVSRGFAPSSWEDTVKHCFETGLREEAEELEEAARAYFASGKGGRTRRVRKHYDLVGETVKQRKLDGYPDCCIDYRVEKLAGKTIKIVVDRCESCVVEASTIQKRGRTVFTVVRALERQGYSVELSVGVALGPSYGGREDTARYKIQVKKAGEYIDPAIVAFYLIDPCAQRRIFFHLQEKVSAKEKERFDFGGSYGCVMDYQGEEDEIVLPTTAMMEAKGNDPLDFLKKRLAEKGIDLEKQN